MRPSRRLLARYAVDRLAAGDSVKTVASHLAAALIDSRRAGQVELLLADIDLELENRGQLSKVTVTTASELTESLRKQIEQLVRGATGVKQVEMNEIIDDSVIGGVRIDSPTRTWDRTVKREITQIREAF